MKTAEQTENPNVLSARICATGGAAVWSGVALLAHFGSVRVGAIELLFLFAPLVIVPLGLELRRVVSSTRFAHRIHENWVTRLHSLAWIALPFGAGMAVVALLLPPGMIAGLFAFGWMTVCLLLAAAGITELASSLLVEIRGAARVPLVDIALAMARVDLVVGGTWFVASRFGMRPMGIQEPIGLLTAVHFHFAGFATATIAGAMLHFVESRGQGRWLRWIVPLVVGLPFVIALGFVISPLLKMAAAVIFSASVAALAILLPTLATHAASRPARVFLHIAAVSVFLGMMLSCVYAIADLRGSDVLPIPQMARTHGLLNAVGFCLCGLLGWLIELTS